MWLAASGFMVMGSVSGLSLDSRLAWLIFGLTQGLYYVCLSQPGWIPAGRLLGGWQDIQTGVSSLFLALP